MKKLIANCLIAFTLLSTSVFYVAANPVDTSAADSSVTNTLGRYILAGTFRVQAQHITWHKIFMTAGTNVNVSLSGDGATGLDMYVYDAGGEIARSTRSGDDQEVNLEIYRSGYIWVKVVNYGFDYNDYTVTAIEY